MSPNLSRIESIINSVIAEDASVLGRRDSAISSVRLPLHVNSKRLVSDSINDRKSEKPLHSARSPRRRRNANSSRKGSPIYIAPLIDCRWQFSLEMFSCGQNHFIECRIKFASSSSPLWYACFFRIIAFAFIFLVCYCGCDQPTQYMCHHRRRVHRSWNKLTVRVSIKLYSIRKLHCELNAFIPVCVLCA